MCGLALETLEISCNLRIVLFYRAISVSDGIIGSDSDSNDHSSGVVRARCLLTRTLDLDLGQ